MKNELRNEVNQIKKNLVVSLTKYSLEKKSGDNRDLLLNSILLTWFDEIESKDDFLNKYQCFQKINSLIQESSLFDLVELIHIEKIKDSSYIEKSISLYCNLISQEDYKKYAIKSGYQIPLEFGKKESYLDDSLMDKVIFYRFFCKKLENFYQSFIKKGGLSR